MSIKMTVAGLFLLAASPAPQGVEALAWLGGSWASETEGRWTEEQWIAPRGGIMLGHSRSGSGGTVREFEFLRIAADEQGVVSYWASPGGREPTGFKLVESGPTSAAFENPSHDYPQRISYRREGATLTATIAGANGANPQSWVYRRR